VSLKRTAPLFLKAILSVALIAFVLQRVNLQLVWVHLGALDFGLLALGAGLVVVQIVIGALRWQAIMAAEGAGVGALRTLKIYYIGVFFNTWAPGAVVGDVLRTWYARRAGLALPSAISSVILDRIMVVVSLVLITALTQYILPAAVQSQPQVQRLVDASWIALALAIAALCALLLLDRLPASVRSRRLVHRLLELSISARCVLLHPPRLFLVLLLAVLGQATLSLAIYELARSLNVGVSLLNCIILMQPVILASYLPVSIGGWGVREGAMVFILGLVGIAPEKSLLLSVMVGIVGMAISVPGGLIWLASRDINTKPMVEETVAVEEILV
jgi:glycosyltransferase 2 family protein